jgi:hypothetical protein
MLALIWDKGADTMRFGRTLLLFGVIMAVAFATVSNADAQLRRRSPVLRAQTIQRRTGVERTVPNTAQKQELISSKVVQLSPMLAPAVGPSGAQGVASFFYNDVDTSLNSGNLVVTGLPAGRYYAWLVFFDPFAKKNIYSELVAEFEVHANGGRTETALTIGLPVVINISDAKQVVVTNKVQTSAEVGRKPIPGAAGYSGGPASGQAVLAANIN